LIKSIENYLNEYSENNFEVSDNSWQFY
jgi:hypothetical protein